MPGGTTRVNIEMVPDAKGFGYQIHTSGRNATLSDEFPMFMIFFNPSAKLGTPADAPHRVSLPSRAGGFGGLRGAAALGDPAAGLRLLRDHSPEAAGLRSRETFTPWSRWR